MGTRKLIKVNRFDDVAKDTLDEWIYFLKNEEIKDEFSAKGLREAKAKLDVLKLPGEERRAYERYLEDLSYQASMVQSSYGIGLIKGQQKGEKKGEKKGKLLMAKALKDEGVALELIAKTSGLSVSEIKEL